MHPLLTFTWEMTRGLDLGFFTLRFYSLLFAGGFVLGYLVMKGIFKREGLSQDKLDTLLTYVVIATILGARLGHVFFYQWDYYSQNPGEILKIWEGGLASHGAAVAIIIAIVIYAKRELNKSWLWMIDRVVITVALAGTLIRMGNFFNSEIYGAMANSSLETVYVTPSKVRVMENNVFGQYLTDLDFDKTGETLITDSLNLPLYNMTFSFSPKAQNRQLAEQLVINRIKPYLESFENENKNILIQSETLRWENDQNKRATVTALGIPRHPTQIYEALGYFIIFLILYRMYWRSGLGEREGFLFGMFLILIFGFRFGIEYFKEVQVSSEIGQNLNIGQKLSIPLVLIGLLFAIRAKKTTDEQ